MKHSSTTQIHVMLPSSRQTNKAVENRCVRNNLLNCEKLLNLLRTNVQGNRKSTQRRFGLCAVSILEQSDTDKSAWVILSLWSTSSTEVTEYHWNEPGWCFYNNNFLLRPWCEGYLCCWYSLMTFWVGDIDDGARESWAMFKACDFNSCLSYRDSNDVSMALEQLESNWSSIWNDFVQYFFPKNKLSYVKNLRMREKHDALIKVLYLVMKDNLNPTPLNASLVQKMYDLTRSKEIIKISSSLGFCCGYKTTKNLDFFIAK